MPVHIFRLAGIYGPGRSVFDKLNAGTARRINKKGQVFGRIHVDDIAAAALEASIAAARGNDHNVADDEPAAPGDVVAHAAGMIGVEPPPRSTSKTRTCRPWCAASMRAAAGSAMRASNPNSV